MLVDDRELSERATRIDALLEEVQSFPDLRVRDKATEIVESLLLLYGEGLARMLDQVVGQLDETSSDRLLEAFASDELISHLLLLHDLHPVTVETRVARALEEVRPYLESHGGNVELLGIEEGVAKLRLQGSCSGCPSSTMTLKLAIEEAIRKAAPELDGIEAEGVAQPRPQPISFLPASDIIQLTEQRRATPQWIAIDTVPDDAGDVTSLEVAGEPLILIRGSERLYAYRNACSACGATLHDAALHGVELTCAACGHSYDVRLAGQSLRSTDVHLEPVPLLVRDGTVNVAVGTA